MRPAELRDAARRRLAMYPFRRGRPRCTVLAIAVLSAALFCMPWAAAAQDARKVTFPPRAILAWERHAFEGRTDYALVTKAGREAVRAHCEQGASGLFLRRPIDLRETPVVEWSWLVPAPPDGPDETTRAGDDFSARVYAVDEHALLPWRSRALNYVWSRSRPVGSDWPNPFAEQARMVAVASGAGDGTWTTHRRNLRADFRRYHDRDVERLDALAVMTDCDNTGRSRVAWYGTIRLLEE